MNQIPTNLMAPGGDTETRCVPHVAASPMHSVRGLERRDLEEVADIFLRVFRRIERKERRAAALPAVVAHLAEVYLDCPWLDADRGSLVLLCGDGAIRGFLGSIQLPMSIDGRPLLASAMGNFMVAERERHAGAGLDLLRTHLANGLDVHFTDTANRTSLAMRRGMRFELLPFHSLEWVLPLRPARLAVERAGRRWPSLPTRLLDRAVRPIDAPLRRSLRLHEMRGDHPTVGDASRHELFAFAVERVRQRRFRPEWTAERFEWLLDRASKRTGNGPLRLREARDGNGRVVGRWLIYAEAGSVASVLQVFAVPRRETAVVAALIRDADELGCLAVRGSAEPELIEALYTVPGILFHHKGATAARTADPDVMAALRAGDVSIGGLTGESWTRFVSDTF
ncbi:MAG: hypothetical protein OEL76_12135 [Siculibacillus sp.]|nr:hypothetical protein [Siculibacillus sp.]